MSCDLNTPAPAEGGAVERWREGRKGKARARKQCRRVKDRGRGKLTFDRSDVYYLRG